MTHSNHSRSPLQRVGCFLWTTFKVLFLIGLLLGILGLGAGVYLFKEIAKETPPLDLTKIHAVNSSVIYDRDGNVISEFGVEKREWISYEEISPVVIDAFVATEDSNFFTHPGVDFKRLGVAILTNLIHGDDQGASTITQQLIKQTHLSSEKTITRKIQEMVLAFQIEKELTKEQILEAYLNYSAFGGGIYGIEKASQYYFGCSASELTLSQAAVLAGLVQRPESYRPDYYPDDAEYRRDIVLRLMVRHGYITEDLALAAKSQPITDLLACDLFEIDDREKYQSFIDHVLTEVETKYGLDPRDGLQIYTTMDPAAQVYVYDLQHPTLSKDHDLEWPSEMQSGIVLMETQTGQVLAIGGGHRDEETERGFNFATQLKRQPGSTAKPIFAYGPAIEHLNWGTGTMLDDELYTYQDGSEKIIHNYNHVYGGRMTLRNALNKSLNVPAVKSFNAVGKEKVQAFAEHLGFTFTEEIYESMAIGGVATGYSPLQMAGAYAAFGNQGIYQEPITVTKVITSKGEVFEAKQEQHRAMSEETAYLMTDLLHTVMTEGTGTVANVSGMYLSGKTGTTNFAESERKAFNLPSNAIRDSWFVGYSSDLTAAVWTGYNDNSQGQYITSQTQSMPWHVFNRLMKKFNSSGAEAPTRPATVQSYAIELESGDVDGEVFSPSALTPSSYIKQELFIKGHGPSKTSSRFSQLETPKNLKGEVVNGKLILSWDHISGFTLSESDLNAQISKAQSLATGASYLKDLPKLNPTESQLRMMLKQLQTLGQTLYDIYGVSYEGEATRLGSTDQNQWESSDLSLNQLSRLASVYIVARYEKLTDLTSEPSESIKITCEACQKPVEVPDAKGWSKTEIETWANDHQIKLTFKTETSNDIETDTVLRLEPESGLLFPEDSLTVVLAVKSLKVPNLTQSDSPESAYRAWAEEHGLTLKINETYHEDIPNGHLIQVLPQIGTIVKKGDTLTLVQSKGAKPLTPPTTEDLVTESTESIESER